MAIIISSDQSNELLHCVICDRDLPPTHMTAGMVDTQGRQQFACYGHSWEDDRLILGWAWLFAIEQRQKLPQHTALQPHAGYMERRPITGNDVIGWDIAHHLFTRQLQGKVIILTSNPFGLLSTLRKQWLRVMRKVQRERSSTLDAALIGQLAAITAHMQTMTFTSKSLQDELNADVYVLSNEQLPEVPFDCHTFYATESMKGERLTAIEEVMPYGGLVVFYR